MTEIETLQELLDNGCDFNELIDGMTYLHHAIDSDNAEVIDFLIKHGADVSSSKYPNLPLPIHFAAKMCKNQALSALLSAGVDPNMQTTKGNCPLITAICSNNAEGVSILLSHGADPNIANNKNEIPLSHAIYAGEAESVRLLLEKGSKVFVGSHNLLHYAVRQQQAECCRLILASGADATVKDSKGKNALDFAMKNEDPTIELMLRLPKLPDSVNDKAFAQAIVDFVETKIATLRNSMASAQVKIPEDLHQLIADILAVERSQARFVEYIRKRSKDLEKKSKDLLEYSDTNSDPSTERLAKKIKAAFSKKVQESTHEQLEFSSSKLIYSPNGMDLQQKWAERTQAIQAFIEETMAKGLSQFSFSDDCLRSREKCDEELEFLKKIAESTESATEPFQKDIISFVVAIREKACGEEDADGIDDQFVALIQQINETNPKLVDSEFPKVN